MAGHIKRRDENMRPQLPTIDTNPGIKNCRLLACEDKGKTNFRSRVQKKNKTTSNQKALMENETVRMKANKLTTLQISDFDQSGKVPTHVLETCVEKHQTRKKQKKNPRMFLDMNGFFFQVFFFFREKKIRACPTNMSGYFFHEKKN